MRSRIRFAVALALLLGAVLLALALGVGAGLAGVLAHFPVVVLAALLCAVPSA